MVLFLRAKNINFKYQKVYEEVLIIDIRAPIQMFVTKLKSNLLTLNFFAQNYFGLIFVSLMFKYFAHNAKPSVIFYNRPKLIVLLL